MFRDQRKNSSIVAALLLSPITCWRQWQFLNVFKPFVCFLYFPTAFFSSRIGGTAQNYQISTPRFGRSVTARTTLFGLVNTAGKRWQVCHSNHF